MRSILLVPVALLAIGATVNAATFRFDTDPFAGTNALTNPGRDVIGGEPFITFDIASDVFSLESTIFGVGNQLLFANDLVENLPTSGVNMIVLQTFDNDNDPSTPFGAGTAANLIANRITSSGPGFFIYFNSVLDLPRLVFSTDLSENTADLKILARMTNLGGQPGRDAMSTFTASNFEITQVPEPSTGLLMLAAGALWAGVSTVRRKSARS